MIDIDRIDSIALAYGELVLKGKNRGTFEKNINKRLKNKLKELNIYFELYNDMSKEYIYFEKGNANMVYNAIKNIFGINSIFFCEKVSDIYQIEEKLIEIADHLYKKGARTFKIEVNRANKSFEGNSMELARNYGAIVLKNTEFEKVDVKNPDAKITIDIRKNIYIYTEKIRANGGMPLASAGKGLSLISGGIDSPVASFMMAKRGLKMSYVTFHSFPFTSQKALDKIEDLVKILTEYNGTSVLYKVNILKIQNEIKKKTNIDYTTILTRRAMMRIAKRIALENEYKALVTGESLAQVASQTIGGLTCTNMVADMPVFRPLIGFDKIEIMDKAREIGTYEKSIEPYEDSCSMFAPKHPCTNPKIEDVIREEGKIENYDKILDEIYNDMEMVIVK